MEEDEEEEEEDPQIKWKGRRGRHSVTLPAGHRDEICYLISLDFVPCGSLTTPSRDRPPLLLLLLLLLIYLII